MQETEITIGEKFEEVKEKIEGDRELGNLGRYVKFSFWKEVPLMSTQELLLILYFLSK